MMYFREIVTISGAMFLSVRLFVSLRRIKRKDGPVEWSRQYGPRAMYSVLLTSQMTLAGLALFAANNGGTATLWFPVAGFHSLVLSPALLAAWWHSRKTSYASPIDDNVEARHALERRRGIAGSIYGTALLLAWIVC